MEAIAVQEKPILFSGPMIRAILEGRKTQTRRVCKPQPHPDFLKRGVEAIVPQWPAQDGVRWFMRDGLSELIKCPYKPGDRLWVRETFLFRNAGNSAVYRAAIEQSHGIPEAAGFGAMYGGWKPSIFMPRWASRLTLGIVSVKVERVQDISEEDAKAEGVTPFVTVGSAQEKEMYPEGYRANFKLLWDSINSKRDGGKYAWDKNPFVWAITFKNLGAAEGKR